MKKLVAVIVALAVVAGLAYAISQGMLPGIHHTDRHIIIRQTQRFFECLQFKEYEEAANFHNEEDRKLADIPKLIEQLFKIPPEQLDIQEYNLLFAEIDSSGILGRVETKCAAKVLNTEEIKRPEIILYWKKEGDKWNLKLRSSLERFGR